MFFFPSDPKKEVHPTTVSYIKPEKLRGISLGSSFHQADVPRYGKPCTTRFQAMEEPVETQEGPASWMNISFLGEPLVVNGC